MAYFPVPSSPMGGNPKKKTSFDTPGQLRTAAPQTTNLFQGQTSGGKPVFGAPRAAAADPVIRTGDEDGSSDSDEPSDDGRGGRGDFTDLDRETTTVPDNNSLLGLGRGETTTDDQGVWGTWQTDIDEHLDEMGGMEEAQLATLKEERDKHGLELGGRLESAEAKSAAAARAMGNRRASLGGSTIGGGAQSSNRQLAIDSMRMGDAVTRQHGQEAREFGIRKLGLQSDNLVRKSEYLRMMATQAIEQGRADLAVKLNRMANDATKALLALEIKSDKDAADNAAFQDFDGE